MVGYRILRDESIVHPGSRCPSCKHPLCWYDNIPLLSYFLLKGRCRYCHTAISFLYPFIELLTAVSLYAVVCIIDPAYWLGYFLFFSALIVTTRTDLEQMLISRYASLLLIPFGWILSAINRLPLSLFESVIGSIAGYTILYLIAYIFKKVTSKEGMGQGDLELLAFIGAFTGPLGVWATLTLASVVGSLIGACYMAIFKQKRTLAIPFGPFLALGAMTYTLFQGRLILMLFGT